MDSLNYRAIRNERPDANETAARAFPRKYASLFLARAAHVKSPRSVYERAKSPFFPMESQHTVARGTT